MQSSSTRRRQLPQHHRERRRAVVHAVKVPTPGFGGRALDCEHLERTDLWHDNYDEGEQVGSNPWFSAVTGPLGFSGKVCHVLLIESEFRARSIGGKPTLVEHRFGVREGRQKRAGTKAVSPQSSTIKAENVTNFKTVSFAERRNQLLPRYLQSDVAEILGRSQMLIRDLVDIKCKLNLAMCVLAPSEVH